MYARRQSVLNKTTSRTAYTTGELVSADVPSARTRQTKKTVRGLHVPKNHTVTTHTVAAAAAAAVARTSAGNKNTKYIIYNQ